MVTKQRLEQYKEWFENLSFFGNNSFVLDAVENLWKLTNYIEFKYRSFRDIPIDSSESYTELDLNSCISLAQCFFEEHNIPININKLRENGTLILIDNSAKEKDNFSQGRVDGHCYYDENKNKRVSVVLEGNIFDSVILIHEITHYRNQPDESRSFANDLLTESLSYAMEFIFFEDLKDSIYESDRKLYFKLLQKLIYNYNYMIYYIYKIILLYKKEKDISKEAYDKLFDDNMYEDTIEIFEDYTLKKKSILRNTWLVIGLPLAIYMLEEYKKDKSFMKSLERFNFALENESIDNCLLTIGIKNKEELINVINNSTISFIDELDKLYSDKDENKKIKNKS